MANEITHYSGHSKIFTLQDLEKIPSGGSQKQKSTAWQGNVVTLADFKCDDTRAVHVFLRSGEQAGMFSKEKLEEMEKEIVATREEITAAKKERKLDREARQLFYKKNAESIFNPSSWTSFRGFATATGMIALADIIFSCFYKK